MNYFTASVVAASVKSSSINPNDVKCELCEENEAVVKCPDVPVPLCHLPEDPSEDKGHCPPPIHLRG